MPMLFRWGVFFLLGLMLLSAQAQSNRDGFYIGIDARVGPQLLQTWPCSQWVGPRSFSKTTLEHNVSGQLTPFPI